MQGCVALSLAALRAPQLPSLGCSGRVNGQLSQRMQLPNMLTMRIIGHPLHLFQDVVPVTLAPNWLWEQLSLGLPVKTGGGDSAQALNGL